MHSNAADRLYADTLQTLGLSRLRGRRWQHVTPRYMVDRLGLHLYQRRHPDYPWLTRQMIDVLSDWLKPSDIGHEWGSGRSTVWLAKRVGQLTSVESHGDWGETVHRLLDAAGVSEKVDLQVIETGGDGSVGPYVDVMASHPDSSLDFCLVDGLQRDECARSALPKLKPGGLLIVDNVNWYLPRLQPTRSPDARGAADRCATEVWRVVHEQLASWRCIWTTNGVTDTALWMKPC